MDMMEYHQHTDGTEESFETTRMNAISAPSPKPDGMNWIPRGKFTMGMLDPTSGVCGGHEKMNDARPLHAVDPRGKSTSGAMR